LQQRVIKCNRDEDEGGKGRFGALEIATADSNMTLRGINEVKEGELTR